MQLNYPQRGKKFQKIEKKREVIYVEQMSWQIWKVIWSQVRLSNEFADHLLSVINGSLYQMGQQDVRDME